MQFFMLTAFTCICLVPIDQYLSICARIQWRQWSNIKTAHRLTILSIIDWLLHGILYLIHFDLVPFPGMGETSCANKQITKMAPNQLFYNFIFTSPYAAFTIWKHFLANTQDPVILAQAEFASVMTTLFCLLSFARPFYVYISSSERF
ncbi:unnamed protein product, partial [Rotaria magnacalcarata]